MIKVNYEHEKEVIFSFLSYTFVFVLLGITMWCKDNVVNDCMNTDNNFETCYQDKVDEMNIVLL